MAIPVVLNIDRRLTMLSYVNRNSHGQQKELLTMVVETTDLGTIRKGNVLVDFYTSSCGPCRALSPILEEVSQEIPEIRVAKIEVTKCPDATQVFGISCVPTVMFLQDSKVREVTHGLTTKKNLLSMVQRYLAPV